MTTAIITGSVLLFLAGVWLIVRWGGMEIKPPADVGPDQDGQTAKAAAMRRFFWWANLWCFTALITGVLMTWPGGRLLMRVLAATSLDSAQGRLTEAQANVGFITLDGTLALLVFGGMPTAFVASLIYLTIHRWLPPGRLSGPLAGLLGIVVFGAGVEPFRTSNIDFTFIGPGWLSVLLFILLAVLTGAIVAAAAGWYSQRLPLFTRGTLPAYLPLLTIIVFPPAAVLILLGALLVVAWPGVAAAGRNRTMSPRYLWAGRALLALAVLLALPAFVAAVSFVITA
ncbi:hypothetical protein AAIH32_11960 [Pseudarthrobacter oxydans]|uniref:hypothetical protein n=1 Tax=Pseudarthrobacter oxydans TaxID=1671 RepID=UPI003D290C3D